MFAAIGALVSSLLEFLLFIGIVVIIYNTFVSDWWDARRMKMSESKTKLSSIDKIAQVKLVSDDKKDIEQFVTTNAQYLSDPMVKRLVARLEELKVDSVIINDELLKKRIDNLPKQVEEEEYAEKTRSKRARN
jgi:hypothetical protein